MDTIASKEKTTTHLLDRKARMRVHCVGINWTLVRSAAALEGWTQINAGAIGRAALLTQNATSVSTEGLPSPPHAPAENDHHLAMTSQKPPLRIMNDDANTRKKHELIGYGVKGKRLDFEGRGSDIRSPILETLSAIEDSGLRARLWNVEWTKPAPEAA